MYIMSRTYAVKDMTCIITSLSFHTSIYSSKG